MKIELNNHSCTTKKCLPIGKHSNITLTGKKEAKGVSYLIENDNNSFLSYYDLDDCAYPKVNKKQGFELCDYVIISHNQKKEQLYIWVELKKTSDLNKCCSQILNSFNNAVDFDKEITHYARAVVRNVNKNSISGDSFKRLKNIFKNRFDYSSKEYKKDKSSKLYLKIN